MSAEKSRQKQMQATLQIHPDEISERSLRLILAKAQEWNVPPAEAIKRLLDQLAERALRKPAA
jgi:predicted TPR repeat methyltransferase